MQISDKDDIIVLLAGTNNIPKDSICECIDKIEDTINEARALKPKSTIIIPEIFDRYDDQILLASHKIRNINLYLEDKCRKSKDMVLLKHDFNRWDFNRGGLHLSKKGKKKFADSIKFIVRQVMSE